MFLGIFCIQTNAKKKVILFELKSILLNYEVIVKAHFHYAVCDVVSFLLPILTSYLRAGHVSDGRCSGHTPACNL